MRHPTRLLAPLLIVAAAMFHLSCLPDIIAAADGLAPVPAATSAQSSAIAATLAKIPLQNIPSSVATITVTPDKAEQYAPIVAELSTEIPEGAVVYGDGWVCSDGMQTIPVSSTTQHVWAKPGTHTISYRGVWVHTKTVEVLLADGTTTPIESFLGAGVIDTSTTFVVEGENGPDPTPDPEPNPNPTPLDLSKLLVSIVEEADDRMQGLQGAELSQQITEVRQYLSDLGVQQWMTDDDQPAARDWVALLDQKSVSTRPALVVSVPSNDNKLVGCIPFGKDAAATIAALKKMGVKGETK